MEVVAAAVVMAKQADQANYTRHTKPV